MTRGEPGRGKAAASQGCSETATDVVATLRDVSVRHGQWAVAQAGFWYAGGNCRIEREQERHGSEPRHIQESLNNTP
jgi:hypothetical protein